MFKSNDSIMLIGLFFFAFVKMVSEEDYRSVLEECVDLKKDVANGVKEVINLRWT